MRLSTRELQALRAIMGELDPAACLLLYGSHAAYSANGHGTRGVVMTRWDAITTYLQRKGCVAP